MDSLTRCTQPVPPYHTAPAHFSSCPARSLRQNSALASLEHRSLLHTFHQVTRRGARKHCHPALCSAWRSSNCSEVRVRTFYLAAPPLLLGSTDRAPQTLFSHLQDCRSLCTISQADLSLFSHLYPSSTSSWLGRVRFRTLCLKPWKLHTLVLTYIAITSCFRLSPLNTFLFLALHHLSLVPSKSITSL